MNCLKEEIRKILYNKSMIVFLVICTIFNIGLIIATSSKSGELKKCLRIMNTSQGRKYLRILMEVNWVLHIMMNGIKVQHTGCIDA